MTWQQKLKSMEVKLEVQVDCGVFKVFYLTVGCGI